MSGPPEARWRILPQDPDAGARLAGALGITPVTAQILLNRGIREADAARTFLRAGEASLASPFGLPQMDRVVDRVVAAVRRRTPIIVYGDYDADGVTATAILIRALRRAGAVADWYVPDRHAEGYGLHPGAVGRLASGGARLIIAVDCGITATDAADAARASGADLIILDHHVPLGALPAAYAVVNPKLAGGTTDYCAAGLALQAARGLAVALGSSDEDPGMLSMAAIGTVADAVALMGDNRSIVARGLDCLERSEVLGVRALLDVTGTQGPLRTRDLSHVLAPRLNAAGRLAHASAAVRLLVSEDAGEVRRLAGDLDRLNQERRALCDRTLADAIEEIDRHRLAEPPAIVLAREDWHPGVLGIVASQLVERYYRPAILIGVRGGVGKGSARSIPPLHLVDALAQASGGLTAFGGHQMAAGLTLPAAAIAVFRQAFIAAVQQRLRPEDLTPVIEIDVELELSQITVGLATELLNLAPCGAGNPEPRFLSRGLRAVGTRTVGGGEHLRLVISDGTDIAEAIGFRLGDRAELLAFTQAQVDVAYAVTLDRWRQGTAVQMVVDELWTPDVDINAITADTGTLLARLFDRAEDYVDARGREIEEAPALHTKVVGVTFEGRQALLPSVRPGQPLRLFRDPGNPRDPHAIGVSLPDGRRLGYLRATLAALLAPAMDAGVRYTATATALTGGGDRAWGLNIHVEREAARSAEALQSAAEGAGMAPGRSGGAEGYLGWLTARVVRGRPIPERQRQILNAVLSDPGIAVRFGPGRGLPACVGMAGAALVAQGHGPVAVVLPRAHEVEAWYEALGLWLRETGLRVRRAHGAMPLPVRRRAAEAAARGDLDVLVASSVWMGAEAPAVGSVILVTDDASARDDAVELCRHGGMGVRLATGPLSEGAIGHLAGTLGLEAARLPLDPRVNLRITDHRQEGQSWRLGTAVGRQPGKTVVVCADAASCVEEARRLRAEADAVPVAYYHDGLPPTLRRVLEDLFASGTISTMAAGSLFVHPSAPGDLVRVVAAGLPPTRLLAAESLAAAGGGGQTAWIDLRLGRGTLDRTSTRLETWYPSRESLVRCYRHFREQHGTGSWTWPSERPSDGAALRPPWEMLEAALKIFLEAGIAAAEGGEVAPVRYRLVDLTERVDVARSPRYREGVRAHAAWSDTLAWAMGPVSAILRDLAGQ